MRLTPENIDWLESRLSLSRYLVRGAEIVDLLADWREMHAKVARLEQRLQDAEGDARRFCGLAGAAMRGERVKG